MQFKEINNYKYIKYVVKVECHVHVGQKMTGKEKTFDQSLYKDPLQKAIAYIKDLKDEIKKFPELYPNPKIIMEKIVTKSDTYEVLEGQ